MKITITGSKGGAWNVFTSHGHAQSMPDQKTARAYALGIHRGYLAAIQKLGALADPVEENGLCES